MMARISVSWASGSEVAAGFIIIEVLCDAKLKKSFDTFVTPLPFLFQMAESIATGSTWGRAFLLWLLTNLLGTPPFLICLIMSNVIDFSLKDAFSVSGIVLLASFPTVVMAKWVFGRIAIIPYAYRFAALVVTVFLLFLTPFTVLGLLFSWRILVGIIVGGWLYLIAALVVAAYLYRQLLRQQPMTSDDAIE